MCGKDSNVQLPATAAPGSPPHVRERPDPDFRTYKNVGITPACAGKTYHVKVYYFVTWDHPRMCGKDNI